jgi:hypothetical protein
MNAGAIATINREFSVAKYDHIGSVSNGLGKRLIRR